MIKNILLAITSLVITYGLMEATYRLYRYIELSADYHEFRFISVESPLFLFDEEIGFRYQPNSELQWRRYDEQNNLTLANRVKVNNMGHVALTDETVTKPPGEFRVAILGDSYTASVTNDLPWPSVLEKILNQDEALKTRLGVSNIRVINFGMTATGIAQWPAVFEHEVSRFQPDVVIVNFITHDILRRFIWMNTIKPSRADDYQITLICGSLPAVIENEDCALSYIFVIPPHIFNDKTSLSQLKREVYQESLRQIKWFTPYPELFAKTVGRFVGMSTRLNLNRQFIPVYADRSQAIDESLTALRAIATQHPQLLILHNPTYDELVSQDTMPSILEELLQESDEDLEIIPMANYLPDQYRQESELRRLFSLPEDHHFSDYGAEMYAELVDFVLKQQLINQE
jgi:hypothetical protein